MASPAYLVECTECDKRLETDAQEAAALFEREHREYAGHEVSWERGSPE